MNSFLKPSELQPKKIQYSKSAGSSIRISHDKKNIKGKDVKVLQMQIYRADYSLPVKFDRFRLNLFLDGYDEKNNNKEIEIFHQKLLELDKLIPKLAYKNRKRWFTEDLWDEDLDTFQENYYSLVQCDKITNRDCLKLNLFTDGNGGLSCEVYDKNKELITDPIAVIQELAFSENKLSGIIRSKYIWINEEAYGMNWEILQIKISPKKNDFPKGFQILKNHQEVLEHESKGIVENKQNDNNRNTQHSEDGKFPDYLYSKNDDSVEPDSTGNKPRNYLLEED